ncbi:MAG TPA: hypothetical protein VFR38_04385 [Gaiellaceae bacterium]|nr:hypothetical protein [Gaiellaceae bacterium]
MRRPWSVSLLLAGALALLVSLYMPWQKASCGRECLRGQGSDVTGLLNLFSENLSVDGWSSGVGDAAALSALLLAAVAGIALARPNLADRLPLGLCAVVVGYFALAVAAAARSVAHQREVGMNGVDFHYAYGAYLGVAGGIVALLAAAALRREELVRERSASQLAALVLGVGLLVSFLLPWQRVGAPQDFTFLGIEEPAALVAAVAVCVAAVWWMSESSIGEWLGLSAATAVFTVAALSGVTLGVAHAYGAWVGLGFALALLALALLGTAPVSRPTRPPWHAVAVAAGAAVLLAALFLPWQKVCYPTGSEFEPYSGRCLATNGWVTIAGSAAAALATLLVAATFAPRRLAVSVVELTAGIAILVATLGFEVAAPGISGVHFGYGSIVGFGAAALVLVLALVRLRFPRFERNRLLVCLAPITGCLVYLVIVVVPWWDVLPRRLQSQSLVHFAPISWLTVAGALLAIHLLGSWARRIADSQSAEPLVLIPLALLALAALDLIRLRDAGITWGGGIVVGLCLLLALLGRIEQREGLENFRVPEVLRVDRL